MRFYHTEPFIAGRISLFVLFIKTPSKAFRILSFASSHTCNVPKSLPAPPRLPVVCSQTKEKTRAPSRGHGALCGYDGSVSWEGGAGDRPGIVTAADCTTTRRYGNAFVSVFARRRLRTESKNDRKEYRAPVKRVRTRYDTSRNKLTNRTGPS